MLSIAGKQLSALLLTLACSSGLVSVSGVLEGNRSFDPAPYSRYFELANEYWGLAGGRATECLNYSYNFGWDFGRRTSFMTVGLEGSGHHMLMNLPKHVTGGADGGKKSYPNGFDWRVSVNGSSRFGDLGKYIRRGRKFLILIRDPVDTWTSALTRFWRPYQWELDTLTRERDELELAMHVMNSELKRVPCKVSLYTSYELLVHHSNDLLPVIAHFFGVSVTNRSLHSWFRRMRDYSVHHSSEGKQLDDSGSTDWKISKDGSSNSNNSSSRVIGPFPAHCNASLDKLLGEYDWPDDFHNPCTAAGALCNSSSALSILREQVKRWIYPDKKMKFPAVVPQYSTSITSC